LPPSFSRAARVRASSCWVTRAALSRLGGQEALMKEFRASFVVLCLSLCACAGEMSVTVPPADDLRIAVTLAGRRPQGDSLVMTVTNVSTHPVFFTRCGPGPTTFVEQFVNGTWTGAVHNFLCVQAPGENGPVELAAGQSLSVSRVLSEAGHYRFAVVGGDEADLSDGHVLTSNEFDVP